MFFSQVNTCHFRNHKMVTKAWLLCLLHVLFNHEIFSRAAKNFRYLVEISSSDIINLRCAATPEDISTISTLVDLLSQDGVIGMYKRSKTEAHRCYFDATRSGLLESENPPPGAQLYLMGNLFIIMHLI